MEKAQSSTRGAESRTVETRLGQMHYRIQGVGAPLVMVHGLFTSSHNFDQLFETVPEGIQAIALDLPGFGETPLPPSFQPSWHNFKEAVVAFIDALELQRIALLGHSMGGGISICTAAEHRDRVEKLILVDAVSYPFPLSFKAKLPTIPLLGPLLFQAYRKGMFIDYFKYDVFLDPDKVNIEKVTRDFEQFARTRAHQRRCIQVTANPSPVAAMVDQIECPVLTLWGESDKLVPLEVGRLLASSLTNAQWEVITDSGHSPLEEQTQKAAPLIWNFLSDIAPKEGL